jgi:heme exporter protein A
MRAIELTDLGRAYGERVALTGVTLEVEEGETLAVFGANGAGKTTLLRILAALLRPHHGDAKVFGHALPREGWAVRGKIGFLGHDPLLYRDLTARENLQFHDPTFRGDLTLGLRGGKVAFCERGVNVDDVRALYA